MQPLEFPRSRGPQRFVPRGGNAAAAHGDGRPCPLHGPACPPETVTGIAPPPWELRRCPASGLVYLGNPPAQDRFRDEFAWEVTHAAECRRRRDDEPVIYAISQAAKRFRQRTLRRRRMEALVERLLTGFAAGPIRLVDVGCASGALLDRVHTRLPAAVADRLEPVGIEISTRLAAAADSLLRTRGGRCLHATGIAGLGRLPAEHAHVIVLSCILEHEIEPLALLTRCRERLAPAGRVVVKVPNYGALGRRLRGRRWCGYRWPDHVNHFTPATLRALAARAGLAVVRMNLADRWPLSDSLYAVLGPEANTQPRARAIAA